ncbi:MAG: hypothetical protein JWP97_5379 [Labilithrix sp.]|nr:hypothetical protein [Labilithrix sp.]
MTQRSAPEAIKLLKERMAALRPSGLNEAATRLLFINEVLENVLGWPVENFNPEEHVASASEVEGDAKRSQWLDYHLRSGESLRLVVEAKRSGETFSLPADRKQRKIQLSTLSTNHGKPLKQVLKQAREYCWQVGTHGFVVTNGHQWIASLAFAQNVAAEKFDAIVFYDLEDIETNLLEFIELLSPSGLAQQTLLNRAIGGGNLVPPFAKKLNDVLRAGPAGKNYLVQPMNALMRTCFGDLTDADHADMLDRCYVASEVTDDYVRRLESFAGFTLPTALPASTLIKRGLVDANAFDDTAPADGTPILIVGRAGSGKSTFLAVMRKRLASQLRRSDRVQLHLDLLPKTQIHAEHFDHDRLIDEVSTDLLGEAEAQYPGLNPYEHALLKEVFAREIQRLRSSLSQAAKDSPEMDARIDACIQDHLKSPLNHLKAYLGYLRTKRDIQVSIFIDNVDRGTTEFERVIFQLSQTLAHNTKATVVTSLRDTTFQDGTLLGFLDVGRYTVFHITPPSFSEVARLRFEYVRARLREDAALSLRFSRTCGGAPSAAVFDFAEMLSDVVLGENKEIEACIQALAGTNIRRALGFVEAFATSTETDLEEMHKSYVRAEKSGKPEFGPSLNFFLRSAMRTSTSRYLEEKSKILNLFQVSPVILSSHFDAIRILQVLAWRASTTGDTLEVSVDDLLGRLGALGHTAAPVLKALNHLGKYGLVNSISKPEPPWASGDVIRLGASGRYYLEELAFNREYVQNVIDDTVIYNTNTFSTIEEIHKATGASWAKKYDEKEKAFLAYLLRREEAELNRFSAFTTRPPWLKPMAEAIAAAHFGNAFVQACKGPTPRTRR